MTPLPGPARWLIARLAPAEWRESIAGDLVEERERRRAAGRRAGLAVGDWRRRRCLVASPPRTLRRPGAATPSGSASAPGWTDRAARSGRACAAWRRTGSTPSAVVVMLALGIGANAAIFTVANWLLFRPLPGVTDRDRLVTIGFGTTDGVHGPISIPDMQRLDDLPALDAVDGYQSTSAHVADRSRTARRVTAEVVAARYFDLSAVPGRAAASARRSPRTRRFLRSP